MEHVIALVILPAAFILDIFFGDPRWLPHPVRWMGKVILLAQPFFRKIYLNLVLAGLSNHYIRFSLKNDRVDRMVAETLVTLTPR